MMTWDKQKEALFLVLAERLRQDEKWGEQNHEDAKWYPILAEEFGEIGKAMSEVTFGYDGADPENIIKEIVETTAVGLAWIECILRREIS